MDKSRFVYGCDEELEEFICTICKCVVVEPQVTQCCRMVFCEPCIESALNASNSFTCPLCRSCLRNKPLYKPCRPYIHLLEKLKVHCDYKNNGCVQVIRLGKLSAHLNVCKFRKCSTCGEVIAHKAQHKCSFLKKIVYWFKKEK